MDIFNESLLNLKAIQHVKEVKVALIGDGCDGTSNHLLYGIADGKLFSEGILGNDSDYFVSTSGYGTLMASLICRICPSAKLYIAKIGRSSPLEVQEVSHLLFASDP
jgi:hypothetical protein